MAKSKGAHIITRDYEQLRGFSTDSKYTRPAFVAELAVNMIRQPDDTFGPRRGYQVVASGKGGLGMTIFENPCKCDTEIVTIGTDGSLYVREENSMTIAYTGATVDNYASYEIFVDPTTVSDPQNCEFNPYDIINQAALVNDRIKFRLYLNGSTTPTLDIDMGKGYGVAFPYPISDLITALNTVPGIVATSTGNLSVPGAFLEVTELTNIASGKSITLNWVSWKEVNKTVPAPFSGLASRIDDDDFINATFASYSSTLYISNAYDFPQKYDGQTVYRAGMPEGAQPTAADSGGGSGPTGTYRYNITYEQDGRIIEGIATGINVEGVLSESSSPDLVMAGNAVTVTYLNLLAGSGWNTNCAIVNGNQVGVTTIVVQNTSTIKTGDTAFFIDASGNEQTREVTAATPISITIAGTAVSVNNNSVISNNLKINIWRNKNGGTIPHLVASVPNNSLAANPPGTSTYSDTKIDTQLGAQYITPARPPNPPPKAAYVVNYRNQLIYTGLTTNSITEFESEDTVYFSEGNAPESVPQDPDITNSFLVPANNDSITGAGQAGSTLVIFKEDSIYGISGDLLSIQFNVTPIAPGSNIGCVAHATIMEVANLLYFLHTSGVYSLAETNLYPTDENGNAIALSDPINKLFQFTPRDYKRRFQFIRATAVNYTQDKQYLVFIPCEQDPSIATLPKVPNAYSKVLCYDYESKDWFEWTNFNCASGVMELNNDLYFMDRHFSPTSTSTSNLYKQHRKYRLIDYVDHVTPIRVTWRSSWEDLGQPKVRKKYLRAALLFDDIDNDQQSPNPQLCFKTYLDWISGVVNTQADISFARQSSPWSTSPWSFAGWDGYQDSFYTVSLRQGTVSKAIQLQLQMNKLNQTFNFKGFGIEIAPDFLTTMVR
jgi:hypothetical protein